MTAHATCSKLKTAKRSGCRMHPTKEEVPENLLRINISIIEAIEAMCMRMMVPPHGSRIIRPRNIIPFPALFIAKALKSFRNSLKRFLRTRRFILIRVNLQGKLPICLAHIFHGAAPL
ncbi:hypothetical protein IEQ34_013798 [Dendrobium chrysotoxum]|uniref:Uncharacterized protein n=1 Tax=Dendrobium chrysotoxum TaxID=161865 RepID=A0AAV7GRV8_DENCH|nr:hypothetical protein IEQ34_013798 [Dendrobium chrysotoxum]